LEFSYNSNHIEGNTLTYRETELLLIRGKTRGNHDAREYEEMKGHDLAFAMIKDWAADAEHPLTESMIRELNKIILKEPFWKEPITSDGQPTRRLIKIGDYKEFPNSVRLQNGEIFEYASPTDTPIKMGELMDWCRKGESSNELHPAALAALLHYNFVRIHPFDDGNGRVSRLLMNYVLLKNDLPPVIIKSADKTNYLSALNNADTGDMDSFVGYIVNELAWSLELSIKAAKGESIEEEEDLDKEIELVKRELKGRDEDNLTLSRKVLQSLYKNSLSKLLTAIENKLRKFNDLFNEIDHIYSIVDIVETGVTDHPWTKAYMENQIFFTNDELYKNSNNVRFVSAVSVIDQHIYGKQKHKVHLKYPDIHRIEVSYQFKGFKKDKKNPFDFKINIFVALGKLIYTITCLDSKENIRIEKNYRQSLSDDECNDFATKLAKIMLNHIKTQSGVQQ
jgi:Fic family protein